MSIAAQTEFDPAVEALILGHIHRYRLTIPAALFRLPELRQISHKQIRAILRQLCRDGKLGQATLYGNRRYYYVPSPQQSWGSNEDRGIGPLSEMAKIRNYAQLAFCCLDQRRRTRLTTTELAAHFPDVYRVGLPRNYYVDTSQDRPRLGFIRVDAGGRGRWDRVLAKCRQDVRHHVIHAGVKPFIEQGAFEITLITALPQKASRLSEAIAQWKDSHVQLVRLSILPELVNLIAPPPIRR